MAQGSSYTALTIDVNVSPTASTTTSIPNQVQVSGGGVTATTSNTDNVTISPAAVLAVQKSHTGTFTQGQTAQWNIAVSNTAASGMTYGTITVLGHVARRLHARLVCFHRECVELRRDQCGHLRHDGGNIRRG